MIDWKWPVAICFVLFAGVIGAIIELKQTSAENNALKRDNQVLELRLKEANKRVHIYQKAYHDLASRIEYPPMPLIEE